VFVVSCQTAERVLFPLRDHNPRLRFPAVTLLLIAVNVLVFVYQLYLGPEAGRDLVLAAGAIPYEIVNWVDIRPRNLLPLPGSIFTSMFLHGGWMHLIGNMWFLWIFGDNVEERLGTIRFVIFYLLAGVVGALAQAFSSPGSQIPMVGASGAIAGVLGGYLMLYPHAKVVTFVAIPFLWHLRDVAAWVFLGLWFIGQFLIGHNSGVAWMAHVGGFLAGLGAVRLLARSRPRAATTEDVEYLPPPRRGRRW
jgi:membrane associated rhomboid family serine protease